MKNFVDGRVSSFLSLIFLGYGIHTQAGPFQNGSFELPALASGASMVLSPGTGGLTGWTVGATGVVGLANGPALGVSPVAGVQHIGFNGGDSAPGGSISQVFDTAIGQTYRVTFNVGRIGPGTGTMKLSAEVSSSTGDLIQSMIAAAPGQPGYSDLQEFTFVAATAVSTLTFRDISTSTIAVDLLLDNVSVTAVSTPVSAFANGSFEAPQLAAGTGQILPDGSTAIVGWTVGGSGVGLQNGAALGVAPKDGNQHVGFNGGNGPPGVGRISQTFITTPGQAYAVSFNVGRTGTGTGTVSLRAEVTSGGGTALGSLNVIAPESTGYGPTNSFSFVASTSESTLTFYDSSSATIAVDPLLDNVTVVALHDCVPLPTAAVSWWPGEGNGADVVGSFPGLSQAITFSDGLRGQAFGFNGVDSRVDFGNAVGNFDTNDFTIEFWIRTSSTRHEAILEKWPSCGYASMWGIRIGSTPPWSGPGRLEAETFSDSAGTDANSISAGRSINDGLFHHVALVRQGTNLVFYIDGVLDVATNVMSGSISRIRNDANMVAGRSVCVGVDGTSPFTGQLDELTIYSRALSGDEIETIYHAGNAEKCLPPGATGCEPTATGLVGWWKGDGNAADSMGTTAGTLAGNAAFGPGRVGQAFGFDGLNDSIVLGNPENLRLQNFTVEAWVKRSSVDVASRDIFQVGTVFGYGFGGYSLGLMDDGRLVLGKVGISAVNSVRSIRDLNWHHVAVTKTDGTVTFYVDGVDDPSATYNPGFTFASDAQIGAIQWDSTTPRATFFGQIDEVAFYNRGLSGAEIAGIFNAGTAGKCAAAGVLMEPAGGAFVNSVTVTLTATGAGTAGASIFYSLDGTDPAPVTTAYSGPFTLTNSATVKAAVFAGGVRVSGVATAEFTVVQSSGGCAPVTDLVGWWKGDGSTADAAGRNTGVLVGNATYGPGKAGQAFSLDGANDGVSFGNPSELQLQNFTIEAWVKRSSPTVTSHDVFQEGTVFGYGYGGYAFGVSDDGRLVLGKVGTSAVDSSRSIRDLNWHHVAVSKSDGAVTFYLDGAGETAASYNPGFTFASDAQIGAIEWDGPTPRASFLGQIDEVAVYNRGLSGAEVAAIYAAGSAGKCSPVGIVVQPSGGVFANSVSVTLTANGAVGSIYYTVNGSDPTAAATLYTGAFALTNTATLRAALFSGGVRVSGVVSAEFTILNTSGGCAAINGLVGWWKGDGNTADLAGNNAGSLEGNTTFGPGIVGQSFILDGSTDGVSLGNPANLRLQNFTIEAWVKRSSLNTSSLDVFHEGTIFGYGYGGYAFGLLDDGRLVLGKVGTSAVNATHAIHDLNWHHVGVTKLDGAVTFFLDGVGEPPVGYNPGFTFASDAQIGAIEWDGPTPRASFLGQIDEVGVYDRALSPVEVAAIVDAGDKGKCLPQARAVAHWSFNESAGNTAHDSAGIYDGTLSAAGATFVPGGISGNAIQLTKATSGFVDMGNVLGMEAGDFSVVAWVKMNSGDTTPSTTIVSKQRSGYANGYLLAANFSGGPSGGYAAPNKAWFYDSDYHGQEVTSTTSVNDGNWHQVVGVYVAGGSKSIYVDGAPAEARNASRVIVANPGRLVIGGSDFDGTPGGMFTGLIDEVAVYNYALNADQVDFLFHNPGDLVPAHDLPGGWSVQTFVNGRGSIQADPDLPRYPDGSSLTLTATPAAGFAFAGWSGGAEGTNNPITLTVNSDKTVLARFVDTVAPTVTLVSPVSGTVTNDEFQLSGTVVDNVEGVSAWWEWNGQFAGSLGLSSNGFSVTGLRLHQGENRIRVVARDAAGNTSAAEAVVTWQPQARALAHWRFDETDGNIAHDSSGAYHGTLSPTGAVFVAEGRSGGALSLSRAANGYVNMGNVLGLTSGDFSVVAWVKMTPGDLTDCSAVLSKQLAGYANGYILEASSCPGYGSPGKAFFYDSDYHGEEVTSTTSVNDGNWHQIVGVYQQGGSKLIYVDGAPAEANKPSKPIVDNPGALVIGGVDTGSSRAGLYSGLIDEVQIYNYALTPTDVDFLFANPSQEVAPFNLPVGWSLTTTASSGGTVQRNPDLARYPTGTNVTLTAVAGSGYAFSGWSGDATGSENPLTLTMDRDKTVTAVFREIPARVLAVVNPVAVREGALITIPIRLASQGEVGGMSFALHYDPTYLREPELEWVATAGSALNLVNADVPGQVLATFALPALAVPAGTQAVANVTFRARSVPFTLSTDLGLEILDASTPTGDAITSGSFAQGGQARILVRNVIGDNNANDQLDIGDATLIQRLLTGLDPVRSWDVTGNDVNASTRLDSGDVIKVLRAVVGLDPQPQVPGTLTGAALGARSSLAKAALTTGTAVVSLDRERAQPGDLVTVQVRLQGVATSVSGVSFQLDYPTNALRLLNALSIRTGALVPSATTVTMWNVPPAQSDYALQSGSVLAAMSSPIVWPTNNGVLAEFVFQVQPGQVDQYRWPIRLSQVEVSETGYDVSSLAESTAYFIGRDPVPPTLNAANVAFTPDGLSLTLTVDSGLSYAVEFSTDLKSWTQIGTFNATVDVIHFVDAAAKTSDHRFYRAVQQTVVGSQLQ